jgi:hypothetical protein
MAVHHANAIAQDRSAREWARRVNRDDCHATISRPDVAEESGYECALAGSWWPGHPDHMCLAAQRKERIERIQPVRVSVFD